MLFKKVKQTVTNVAKTVKTQINIGVDAMKEATTYTLIDSYKPEFEFNGLWVCHKDVAVARATALPSYVPGCALVEFTDGDIVIIVNTAFLQLEKEVQQSILWHEYGHYVHGDLEELKTKPGSKLGLLLGFGPAHERELRADAYAAAHGYSPLKFLQILEEHHGGYMTPSIRARIKALQG